MALLCLLTNTPWPWPTPAGAASARGGFPTLGSERERSGGGGAQRRSAQAQRGRLGCLLSRARDGVPQEAWFPCFARSAEIVFGALRGVPAAGVTEEWAGSLCRRTLQAGGITSPSNVSKIERRGKS